MNLITALPVAKVLVVRVILPTHVFINIDDPGDLQILRNFWYIFWEVVVDCSSVEIPTAVMVLIDRRWNN